MSESLAFASDVVKLIEAESDLDMMRLDGTDQSTVAYLEAIMAVCDMRDNVVESLMGALLSE